LNFPHIKKRVSAYEAKIKTRRLLLSV
jgi:hypothetical protein